MKITFEQVLGVILSGQKTVPGQICIKAWLSPTLLADIITTNNVICHGKVGTTSYSPQAQTVALSGMLRPNSDPAPTKKNFLTNEKESVGNVKVMENLEGSDYDMISSCSKEGEGTGIVK